jgi:hypothetical protein
MAMRIKNFISVIPFIICSIFILIFFKTDITINSISLYSLTTIFICVSVVAFCLKLTDRTWFYVWIVFGFMFGIMALDQLAFNGNIYWRFFHDSSRGFDGYFFPSHIPFRGLIPFLIFYIAFCRKKNAIRIKENVKYIIVITIVYCWFFFISNLYYGTPWVVKYLYIVGGINYNLFVLVNTILFASFILFIIETGFVRLKLIYLLSFFFLIFVTMHGTLLVHLFKPGRYQSIPNFSDIIYFFSLYFKYIWLHSGAVYMLLLLGYRSFMSNRRLKIKEEKKGGSC